MHLMHSTCTIVCVTHAYHAFRTIFWQILHRSRVIKYRWYRVIIVSNPKISCNIVWIQKKNIAHGCSRVVHRWKWIYALLLQFRKFNHLRAFVAMQEMSRFTRFGSQKKLWILGSEPKKQNFQPCLDKILIAQAGASSNLMGKSVHNTMKIPG